MEEIHAGRFRVLSADVQRVPHGLQPRGPPPLYSAVPQVGAVHMGHGLVELGGGDNCGTAIAAGMEAAPSHRLATEPEDREGGSRLTGRRGVPDRNSGSLGSGPAVGPLVFLGGFGFGWLCVLLIGLGHLSWPVLVGSGALVVAAHVIAVFLLGVTTSHLLLIDGAIVGLALYVVVSWLREAWIEDREAVKTAVKKNLLQEAP